MRERDHPWLILTICCVVLANASSAVAQSWLSDRKRAEGHGILLGNLELHPGVGAEVGYYTNPFYSENPTPSAAFRISPHLFLSTLGAQRSAVASGEAPPTPPWIAFNGGLSATYQHFFLFAARDALNTDLSLDLTIAPERPFGLRLTESLSRSALPFSDANLQPADSELPANVNNTRGPDYTRYTENAGAQLLFQTPGGLLRASAGYRLTYAWFDQQSFSYNNTFTHTATLTAAWEFLPKTALFYEGNYIRPSYPNKDESQFRNSTFTRLINSHHINSRLGLNGAITSRLGATIALGYAAGFYDSGDEYEGLVGSVEGRYTPTDASELALVLDRSFYPSYQGNFQERNRIYARFRWLFVGALLMSARAGVEFLTFGEDPVQGNRDDRRYFADLSGEYRFIDWLALTGQVNMLVDDTDFVFRAPADATGAFAGFADPAKFTAFEFWLGVRAFY
jgi:hypothetical protein